MRFSYDSDNSSETERKSHRSEHAMREYHDVSGQDGESASGDDSTSSGMPELYSNNADTDSSSSSSSSSNSSARKGNRWIPDGSIHYRGVDKERRFERHRLSNHEQVPSDFDIDSSMSNLSIKRREAIHSFSDDEEPEPNAQRYYHQRPTLSKRKASTSNNEAQNETQLTKKDKQRNKKAKQKKTKQLKARASTNIQALFRGSLVRIRLRCANRGFKVLQALVRGFCVRKIHSDKVLHLRHYCQFRNKWLKCIHLLDRISDPGLCNWTMIRDQQIYIKRQELVEFDTMRETDEKMDQAVEEAIRNDLDCTNSAKSIEVDEIDLLEERRTNSAQYNIHGNISTTLETVDRIQLSSDVVKWLKTGDTKYKEFFIRRMKQLSRGERSRILAKRLVGSKNTIYETYLEQKSGFRILWTEKQRSIFVWYVAKHKNVSRLMGLIDSATNRSERQRVSDFEIEEVKKDDKYQRPKVLLDPLGNVPLKVYDLDINGIEEISMKNWTPTLYLTSEERSVVEMPGTVLLLGRSGTGKTVCICNRMELDRKRYESDPHFSQLFVSRSKRLCRYVKMNIGEGKGRYFETFDDVISKLESELPYVDGIRNIFDEFDEVDFDRFKSEIYNENDQLDSLLIWTNIRSFIKGSIEAIQHPNFVLSRQEYLSTNNFGRKRCRLTVEQRNIVYDVFTKYNRYLKEKGLWDKGDKIISIINRLQHAKVYQPELLVKLDSFTHLTKIYVDEVQDYTQTEILLFFQMSGPGDLFLAGDPAQNVQKGIEFRFEDIRSVGYFFSGENCSYLIPPKPKIVNVNFRSHAGILDTASAILDIMFSVFPDSTKQLGRDEGLFRGPRPGVFQQAKREIIKELVSDKMNGVVILTHDDSVHICKELLGGYNLVYGIREAKGLEFKAVIVLDFFSTLPAYLQKPWREMFYGRADDTFHNEYPELESQLKLLYTAVTRCIDRLFFCETNKSIAGDAFIRYITTPSASWSKVSSVKGSDGNYALATLNDINSTENMSMTSDEWLVSGVVNAEAAEVEGSAYSEDAHALMAKAIYCFEQSKNDTFLKKARIHLESFQFRKVLLDRQIQKSKDAFSLELVELRVVSTLGQLLQENLLYEASALLKDLRSTFREMDASCYFLDHLIIDKLTKILKG